MALLLGLKTLSKTFAGNFCLLRCIGPTACSYDALRYYKRGMASVKPAKPPNAFLLYIESVRSQVGQEHPELKYKEKLKLMAEMYRKLDIEELKELRSSAEELRKEYKIEMKEYLDSLTEHEKTEMEKEKAAKKKKRDIRRIRKESKQLNKPKKYQTAFIHFGAECRKKGNLESTNTTDIVKEIAAMWRTLTDSQKEEYKEMVREDKEAYEKKLNDWEAERIKEKKYHLVRKNKLFEITGIKRKTVKRVSKKTARTVSKKTARKRKTGVAKKESTAPKRKSKEAKTEPSDLGSETGLAKNPRKKAAVSKKQSKVDVATLSDSDTD